MSRMPGIHPVACFDLLLRILAITIDHLPHDQRECFICKEPYKYTVWKQGESMNIPVRLPCGHHLCIQCLANWMFMAAFDNACSICGVKILPPASRAPGITDGMAWWMASVMLGTIAEVRLGSLAIRKDVFHALDMYTFSQQNIPKDRIMLTYEAWLNMLWSEKPPEELPYPTREQEIALEQAWKMKAERIKRGYLATVLKTCAVAGIAAGLYLYWTTKPNSELKLYHALILIVGGAIGTTVTGTNSTSDLVNVMGIAALLGIGMSCRWYGLAMGSGIEAGSIGLVMGAALGVCFEERLGRLFSGVWRSARNEAIA